MALVGMGNDLHFVQQMTDHLASVFLRKGTHRGYLFLQFHVTVCSEYLSIRLMFYAGDGVHN